MAKSRPKAKARAATHNSRRKIPRHARVPVARIRHRRPTRARRAPTMQPYNPMSPALVATLLPSGKAFPVHGMYRYPINVSGGMLFAITNTGTTATVMSGVNLTGGTIGLYSIPSIVDRAADGGPSSGRAMKAGLAIVNTTAPLSITGQVYVTGVDQRLSIPVPASQMTVAQWQAVADTIAADTRTKLYSAAQLSRPHHTYVHPSDTPTYEGFRPWDGTDSVDTFWEGFVEDSTGNTRPRPMSTIFVYIVAPPVTQQYVLTVRAAYYTRWAAATVMGQSQIPIPTGSHHSVSMHRSIAQRAGAVLQAVEAGAAGAVGALGTMAAYASRAAPVVAEGAELMAPLLMA